MNCCQIVNTQKSFWRGSGSRSTIHNKIYFDFSKIEKVCPQSDVSTYYNFEKSKFWFRWPCQSTSACWRRPSPFPSLSFFKIWRNFTSVSSQQRWRDSWSSWTSAMVRQQSIAVSHSMQSWHMNRLTLIHIY